MRNRCIPFVINFRLLGMLIALPLFQVLQAQNFNVSGTVFDDADGGVLPGAMVQLINAKANNEINTPNFFMMLLLYLISHLMYESNAYAFQPCII